ncbi:MAG: alanine--tRNA ligase [Patescibacteria group bacterium]|nr:alanine--tRNA ligase [Patescibacteria group bacterium]
MTGTELIEKYLNFFKARGHKIIPSASLIPENDPTVLFTTAGMHPLVPYLLGEKHPAGLRLTDVQKCIRTGDIDEVGDDWHLTFFEMLGNWSLGDYFKDEAIKMSFKFLTQELNISTNDIAVSCFIGEVEHKIPKDDQSAEIWKSLGIAEKRIAFLDREDNWWGPAGQTGPCGPDTEMFYWTGPKPAPENFDPKNKYWVEIWNDVFMQYNKNAEGKYEPLRQTNVDTGMGVERTVAILNGLKNVYETNLFLPITKKIKSLALAEDEKSVRIIADHLRSAVFILGDPKGIAPSNVDQGYVLRRLIRRAIRHGKMIGIHQQFTAAIAEIVIDNYSTIYPELNDNRHFVLEQLTNEEAKFNETVELGLKQFDKISGNKISGRDAFILFTTYGFPLEMTKELAAERNLTVDEKSFDEEFLKHQELSRVGAEQRFAGGLADHSAETTRLHTATHLTLAALRQVLGDHVFQKGSNITKERLRLDFSHPDKMTPEQIKQVEDLVNEQIAKKIPVTWEEVSLDEAKAQKAMGVFEHKYTDQVKVYTIGDFSKEICGGPHVSNTAELVHYKITKEEASSAGVRRLKAVLG